MQLARLLYTNNRLIDSYLPEMRPPWERRETTRTGRVGVKEGGEGREEEGRVCLSVELRIPTPNKLGRGRQQVFVRIRPTIAA